MWNHYIPKLLLRQFGTDKKVNTYDLAEAKFKTKKLNHVFAQQDIFEPELEKKIGEKLEGPFADLLNHRLLHGDTININRYENFLIRKFILINNLRSPMKNCNWDDMVKRMKMEEHPSVLATEFLKRHHPEMKFEELLPSKESYISDLKRVMEIETMEEMQGIQKDSNVSFHLKFAIERAVVETIGYWDCEETGQEFILPKFTGVSQEDQVSMLHKAVVIQNHKKKMEENTEILGREFGGLLCDVLGKELDRLLYGSSVACENFSLYPLSPTRMLVAYSPYFRAFFSMKDQMDIREVYPPFLKKEQFEKHFYKAPRMELFEPCKNLCNQFYQYKVKKLTTEEMLELNALLLHGETEEFAFHDFNKIRDSLWYYNHKAKFADKRKHDFRLWE